MRTFVTVAIFGLFLAAFCSPLAAQTYPMPFVNNPLVPAAVPPGGPGFTVAVNGAGFVSGDVVKWDGSARTTTFVSNTRLTAQILDSDIAAEATVSVTVVNPRGGISNSVLFLVTSPTSSLAFVRTDTGFPSAGQPQLAGPTAIFSIGASRMAIANTNCPIQVFCILEHSVIELTNGPSLNGFVFTGRSPVAIAVGDLIGTGDQDFITTGIIGYSIILGPTGTHHDYPYPAGFGPNNSIAVGDFNGDGHLDLVMAGGVLLGNGDGTFGPSANANVGGGVTVGDFNGDGKLDLAVGANPVSILLGNGDGTFQSPVNYPGTGFAAHIATADFNGDGIADVVVSDNSTVSIFLGNGDGTLQLKGSYAAAIAIQSLTIGDYNGDGVPDVAVSDSLCAGSTCPADGSVNVLLGNSDGSLQSHLDFAGGGQPGPIATGSFPFAGGQNLAAGRPGFATINNQQNTISVFDAVFTGPVNPLPTISSISPSSAPVNSAAFTLTANGTNFMSGSTVYFAGQPRVTTFVDATQVTAAIPAGDVSSTGAVSVFILNPTPGGGASTFLSFNIYGPPPAISSLNPSSVVAGGPAFTLLVSGLNFINGAVVNLNGTPRTTTFVSSTQLSTAVTAFDIASLATINISVTNPFGGPGSTTSSFPLPVLPTNTQPVVGALVPASTTAGGAAFTLILTGTGFTASSVVTFKSSIVSSAFVSATQLQAAIPSSAIAVAGTPFVTVANPGGSPSLVTTFTVNNPVPGTSSLSPSTVPAGNAAITLTVTGAGFTTSSTVLVGGASRVTTYVSSTSLTAALLASDFTHSGTLNISVNNPAPGGGTTSALTLTVEDFNVNVPTPTAAVTAGQPANFNLMVVVPLNTITANAITFTASGLPSGATATFSQSATIPAGSSGNTSMMLSITTTPHTASLPASPSRPLRSLPVFVLWIAAFGVLLSLGLRAARGGAARLTPQFVLATLLLIAAGMTACGAPGGASSSGQQINPQTGTPAGVYPITVTATSGSGSLSTTVSLTVM